jgi:DMSO/TMAO reductase YedYZ molybdopterin-dependent catalytic subunit
LLKLTPLVPVGACAIPKLRDSLLEKGLAFSDWAASKWFRGGHLAPTYPDSELAPIAQFSVNSYDVDDPEMDLKSWTLKVTGDVQRPGEYTLEQIQALPGSGKTRATSAWKAGM